jgi:hypothetical protein
MLAHWLTKVFASKRRASVSPRRRTTNDSYRPLLENLEDRLAPATFTVTNLNDAGLGSLRAAIAAANANPGPDTVVFAGGLSGTIGLTTGTLLLTDAATTTILGPGAGVISVSGSGAATVFGVASAASASISGLTITGGSAAYGGGIANAGSLTITSSSITGNSSTSGGGGILNVGYLNVQSSVLSNNTTSTGGDGEGGAILNSGGTIVVNNSYITGNSSTGGGAGIQSEFGETPGATSMSAMATITNSTIANNRVTGGGQGEGGGGLCNEDNSVMNVTNCTITGNDSGTFSGGGISNTYVSTEVLTLNNCTIVGNHSGAAGGGIHSDPSGTVNINNSIVAQNVAGSGTDFDGAAASGNNNLIGDGTGMTGLTNGVNGNLIGTSATPINPLVSPLGFFGGPTPTMGLLPGSPAIDAGGGNAAPTDQRGITRPQLNAPDIGAFESRGFIMTIASGNNQAALVGQPYGAPLVVTVTSAFGEPVVGGLVTFTAPSNLNGPTVIFPNGKTTILVTITGATGIASTGQASVVPTANNIAGRVLVVASANGANSVTFNLANIQAYIAVGADAGTLPEVKVYDALTGALRFDFFAFAVGFRGGVRVAVADVDGDGFNDIICAAGPGGGPEVRVFSGRDGSLLQDFFAFTPTFAGGVYVAAGDVNGDGKADIICGAGAGGGPQVSVFNGADDKLLTSFFPFPVSFTGGVRVAAGDVNGDGLADIICGAGPGGAPEVAVFNGKDFSLLTAFFAFPVNFAGGVYVGAGDLNHSGRASIVVGAGEGGLPEVNVFNGTTFQLINAFFSTGPQVPKVDGQVLSPGVRVAVACEACPRPVLLTGEGPFSQPTVTEFDGTTFQPVSSFFAFNPLYLGGIFVGGA